MTIMNELAHISIFELYNLSSRKSVFDVALICNLLKRKVNDGNIFVLFMIAVLVIADQLMIFFYVKLHLTDYGTRLLNNKAP